ncbi:MAG TPA: succinylglutamate desuccinylase/aspartoacylase family protein [Gemmatimonadales bacterium]|nr:succinylglutamate desuccinylase/aspartoacylase family protein [Gemmatimonadales bacterium]
MRTVKAVAAVIWLLIMALAGAAFAEHRLWREAVVPSPALTTVRTLGDYFAPLKRTVHDSNVYIFDSGVAGGTIMIIGGNHPEEPGASLTAQVIVENLRVERGRIVVVIHANRSASTVTRPGDAYPRFFRIETPWGVERFRMGDRWANPLDSWPDPEVYIHYPSGQSLAYMDIRNLNRTFPGRPGGCAAEQVAHAIMRVIDAERVDLFIDLHEAELEYPVIGTIVSHQNATRVAALTSMELSATVFRIGMEYSPVNLHGLTHREVGDHSRAMALLVEAPEPFLDRVRGITDEALLLTGKDEFVVTAGRHGLLYWPIDENGWPIAVRVGRHAQTFLKICEVWTRLNPARPVAVQDVPGYAQLVERGVGAYLHDPSGAATIVYE